MRAFSLNLEHAANVRFGSVESRTSVRLALTSQQLLLQVQSRVRLALHYIIQPWRECRHAAALGALGLVSSHKCQYTFVAFLF